MMIAVAVAVGFIVGLYTRVLLYCNKRPNNDLLLLLVFPSSFAAPSVGRSVPRERVVYFFSSQSTGFCLFVCLFSLLLAAC